MKSWTLKQEWESFQDLEQAVRECLKMAHYRALRGGHEHGVPLSRIPDVVADMFEEVPEAAAPKVRRGAVT